MSIPFPYSEKEMTTGTTIPVDQSIFTSRYFRSMPLLLPKLGFPECKWDFTEDDLITWVNSISAVFAGAYTGVDAAIGPYKFKLDNTNLALAKASYTSVAEGAKMPNYFPTPELVEALVGTELKWVDAEVFKQLPDAFTIRFPVKDQFKMLLGDGWHSLDDFMLMRAKTPALRKHIMWCHGENDPNPEWEAWYWLSQSRSELDKGLQNSTYGSFIIKENTKLEDLMNYINAWSRGTDEKLRNLVSTGDALEQLDDVAAHGGTRFQRDNADYFRSALKSRMEYSEEGYQTYIDSLKFVIKFAILMNTEEFLAKNLPIPGTKPGKISKKAAEIHQKLLWKWGKRYKVELPRHENPENEPENQGGTHKSPLKHWVMGFFRNQPYGPGRSLRKIKWIPGFWRGTDSLTT